MKKLLACVLCMLLGLTVLSGCKPKMAEIALVTSGGSVDDGTVNQEAWAGIVKYCEEKGISCQSFQAAENTKEACLEAVQLAVKRGAMFVVCAGTAFQDALPEAAKQAPEATFLGLDCTLSEGAPANAVGVTFSEVQAGFLAGYAAVQNGWTKLGFFSGASDEKAVAYGYGFVQGAQQAAKEKEMPAQSIEIRYQYAADKNNKPENEALAKEWYQAGTEAIFAVDATLTKAVISAAEEFGKYVIGSDVDWSGVSQTVAISAVKNYSQTVQEFIDLSYNEELQGGVTVHCDASRDGIALTMDASKLKLFTRKTYDNLLITLADDLNGMASALISKPAEDKSVAASGIVLEQVKVIE